MAHLKSVTVATDCTKTAGLPSDMQDHRQYYALSHTGHTATQEGHRDKCLAEKYNDIVNPLSKDCMHCRKLLGGVVQNTGRQLTQDVLNYWQVRSRRQTIVPQTSTALLATVQ
jgi:hypothetical protein